jgi:hypothetical protein
MTAYVSADAVVPCDATRALARLARVVNAPGDWTDQPVRLTITVGPRRRLIPPKRVYARLSPPRPLRRTNISSLWWTPTGRFASCYPVFHAGLAVTPIDDTSCLLSVQGDYVPPVGRVGNLADHAGLHRVAVSTVQEFTTRLARALALESEEGLP